MIPLPPGLSDHSARRWLLAVIDKKQQELRRNGMAPAEGLAEFAAWLETVTVRDGAARRDATATERKRRSRARLRGEDIPLRRPGPRAASA